MKIAQVYIQNFANFTGFQMDLTYPEEHPRAGQAMDRVCLIGENGAGKSRLMQILIDYLRSIIRFRSKALFIVKLEVGGRFIYSVHLMNNTLFFSDEIDQEPEWLLELIRDQAFTLAFNTKYEKYCIGFEEDPELFDSLWFDNNTDNVILHYPADYYKDRTTLLSDVPMTKGHEAESLKHTFPLFNLISPEKITEFWALLIYLIVKRERAFREYADNKEQRIKPTAIVEANFSKTYPEVLTTLKALWEPLLDKVGLTLDIENAETPRHIKDRLKLYLIRKSNGERVGYNLLGTGLRRHLFSLAHTWGLFFQRELRNSFTFFEEPEESLHPKLLKGLVPQYSELTQAGQMFVSTHHPLIAAEFESAERLILERNEKGEVAIRRSEAGEGAGVEALLKSDFGLSL
ncbi:MAG TPA: ATP-binding protein [Bacteroidetes bacterium]|nr:ATP-binding protein [Bacteroidota bacterium]